MKNRGKFIVVDGMDHCGKDTQIDFLREDLKDKPVLFTREPGGSPQAERIRKMLMDKTGPASNPLCDFFLFYAARASHVQDVVEPTLHAGRHVITNRYDSSTWAYQVCAEQKPEHKSLLILIRNYLPRVYQPDAYFILTLPPEVAYERGKQAAAKAEKEETRFDIKPLAYHQRVQEGFAQFKDLLEGTSSQVQFIDACQTREEVHSNLWTEVQRVLAA